MDPVKILFAPGYFVL